MEKDLFSNGKVECEHDDPTLYKGNSVLCYCAMLGTKPGSRRPITHARHGELCPLANKKKKAA